MAESLFSAESYHFEADLPPGVDVPVASLWVGGDEHDMTCVDVDPGEHQRIALWSRGFERGVAEVRWLPLEEAPRLLAYGGEREMAARALETIGRLPL